VRLSPQGMLESTPLNFSTQVLNAERKVDLFIKAREMQTQAIDTDTKKV
jgi:hypothetical protein